MKLVVFGLTVTSSRGNGLAIIWRGRRKPPLRYCATASEPALSGLHV
jgi:hypothetical protein